MRVRALFGLFEGDSDDVVFAGAIGLEWLAYQCPVGDSFTADLRRALDAVDEELEQPKDAPGLFITIGGVLRDD